jgi:lysophospholipase L1-like esterase
LQKLSIFLFLSFLLFNCSTEKQNTKSPIKILFLGESTTNGLGSSEVKKNYVGRTIDFFTKSGIKVSYKIIAKNGMTSSWGIFQIEDINNWNPDLTIIEFSINDHYISEQEIKSNFEVFAATLNSKSVVVFDIYSVAQLKRIKNNEKNFVHEAHKNIRWKTIDTHLKLPENWAIFTIDEVHPNDLGYEILSNILIEEIYPIIINLVLFQVILERFN